MIGTINADTLPASNGLAVFRWRAADARATLLLQHGYAEHAGRYVNHAHGLVPKLVALGFDVVAVDMPGHGRSQGARGGTDVLRVVDAHVAMRRSLAADGKPVFLFGHSLGGLVTAASVVAAPEDLAGVVLSAPALPYGVSRVQRLLLRITAALAPMAGVSRLGDPADLSRIDAEVRAYLADPLVFRRRLPARIAHDALCAADAVWRGASRWCAPTLILHGTADRATAAAGSERLAAATASVDKELILVPEGRHELLNDVARETTMVHILGWLEGRVDA